MEGLAFSLFHQSEITAVSTSGYPQVLQHLLVSMSGLPPFGEQFVFLDGSVKARVATGYATIGLDVVCST